MFPSVLDKIKPTSKGNVYRSVYKHYVLRYSEMLLKLGAFINKMVRFLGTFLILLFLTNRR